MKYQQWRAILLSTLFGVAGFNPVWPVWAQDAGSQPQRDIFSNPPVLGQSTTQLKGTLFQASTSDIAPAHAGHERVLDLKLQYTDGKIYNPSSGRYDKVHLRSYTGTDVDTAHPFVAPTIEVTPGDTVRIRLDNQLPPDKDVPPEQRCAGEGLEMNIPHCFNGTNLHTHGLWVSPTGNSDNVLVSINPGVKFEYEYNIPADHPAGTFWYHPHRHGSTALQVGSGVAGALIIRGNRVPTQDTNGDLDTLIGSFPERLVEFEQIPYACSTQEYGLKYKTDDKGNTALDWSCNQGETGKVTSYEQFGPGTWPDSGRFTSINGRIFPTVKDAKVGQTERWRLIHAGVRDTIKFEFHKIDAQKAEDFKKKMGSGKPLSADDLQKLADACSVHEALPYALVTADGLTMAQGQERENVVMQPGYRYDLLVNFPEAGDYCAMDMPVSESDSVTQKPSATALLGFVSVDAAGDGATIKDPVAEIKKQLIANAKATYNANVANQVVADLQDGFKLSKFTPHKPISAEEIEKSGQKTQELAFFINVASKTTQFEVGNSFKLVEDKDKNGNTIYVPEGARPYDPAVVDRPVVLGTSQEWKLRSYFVSHPFHIHVNPFEIIEVLDSYGNDVSKPGAKETVADPSDPSKTIEIESQYAGMKGMWKDTIWVKSNNNKPLTSSKTPAGTYTITVRTRYERYIGEFVLHCHILDHEDQGMMQNVAIGVPDGTGGLAHAHVHE